MSPARQRDPPSRVPATLRAAFTLAELLLLGSWLASFSLPGVLLLLSPTLRPRQAPKPFSYNVRAVTARTEKVKRTSITACEHRS